MKYRVGLLQAVFEAADVMVDAATPEEAQEKAVAMGEAGEVEWRLLGPMAHDVEAIECEEIEP